MWSPPSAVDTNDEVLRLQDAADDTQDQLDAAEEVLRAATRTAESALDEDELTAAGSAAARALIARNQARQRAQEASAALAEARSSVTATLTAERRAKLDAAQRHYQGCAFDRLRAAEHLLAAELAERDAVAALQREGAEPVPRQWWTDELVREHRQRVLNLGAPVRGDKELRRLFEAGAGRG